MKQPSKTVQFDVTAALNAILGTEAHLAAVSLFQLQVALKSCVRVCEKRTNGHLLIRSPRRAVRLAAVLAALDIAGYITAVDKDVKNRVAFKDLDKIGLIIANFLRAYPGLFKDIRNANPGIFRNILKKYDKVDRTISVCIDLSARFISGSVKKSGKSAVLGGASWSRTVLDHVRHNDKGFYPVEIGYRSIQDRMSDLEGLLPFIYLAEMRDAPWRLIDPAKSNFAEELLSRAADKHRLRACLGEYEALRKLLAPREYNIRPLGLNDIEDTHFEVSPLPRTLHDYFRRGEKTVRLRDTFW